MLANYVDKYKDLKTRINDLEALYDREIRLIVVTKTQNSEKIINDFFNTKKEEIKTLTNFINSENKILLSDIENLSNIESKLINKIKNNDFNQIDLLINEKDQVNKLNPELNKSFYLGKFMMKWSNKFVFISLLVLSAIALTKQAWA